MRATLARELFAEGDRVRMSPSGITHRLTGPRTGVVQSFSLKYPECVVIVRAGQTTPSIFYHGFWEKDPSAPPKSPPPSDDPPMPPIIQEHGGFYWRGRWRRDIPGG